jgi:hypothetical protein
VKNTVPPGHSDDQECYSDFAFWLGKNLVILVPQVGHVPFAARRPFSIVTSSASFIFRLVLHFMQ